MGEGRGSQSERVCERVCGVHKGSIPAWALNPKHFPYAGPQESASSGEGEQGQRIGKEERKTEVAGRKTTEYNFCSVLSHPHA